ncbi:MAG TPA: sugar phosphate isomerase/epimerase family protein [Rhizobium sp.]
MKAGIFGRTYPYQTAREIFAQAHDDGFRAIQFNLSGVGLPSLPSEIPPGTLETVAALAASFDLEIAALSGTYNMGHPDTNVRIGARSGFENVVRAATMIGAPLVTLCTGSRHPSDMWAFHPNNASAEAWRDMRAELDFALGLAADHGLRLGIEPEPGNIVADARLARRLLDEVGAAAPLGIVLDAANLVGHKLEHQHAVMNEAVDLLGDRLVLAHVKDVSGLEHVTCPGDGKVDLVAFTALLRAAGYDGALVGHGFAAADTRRAGDYLTKLIAGHAA